jgi:RNA polymerase sigma-70 factor (ECF subfamily)
MTGAATDDGLQAFNGERPRLFGLAYRMLGSAADAEDVVQDAWLRWQGADRAGLERPAAWLTTVTTRLAIDRLRAQQRRREAYVGPWLPEPVSVDPGPEETAELAESLTIGFLTFLDTLPPADRAVYLLSEVFARPYAEVAATVGRSQDACRQVVSRARRRLRHAEAAPSVPAGDARRAADTAVRDLLAAVAAGDVAAAMACVAPDAVLVADGGPDRRAARRPVVGPHRIARFLTNLHGRLSAQTVEVSWARLNHGPGVLISLDGELDTAVVAEVDGSGLVSRLWVVRNPDKLGHLGVPVRLS